MSRQFSLLIATKPVWATDPVLVDALVDTVYSVQLVASDTLTFAVRTGVLCPGVTMDAAGLLTGSPTAEGTYVFTVRAEGDSPTVFTDRTFKQVVAAFPTWITASALPDMVAGSAGQAQLVAQSTAFFTVATGFLPSGVTMTPQGLLSGTPASSGTYGFTVKATSASPLFETDKTFAVVVKTSPAWVTAPVLADAVTGTAVSVQLQATEGATYTIVAGQLRGGLAMSPTGLVSGTPALPGSFGFTVRASNATGYGVDRAFTLLVVSTPTWATPATLPDFVADQPMSLQFQAAGATSYELIGTLPTGLSFAAQSGVLSGTPTVSGTYGFDVKALTASVSVSSTRTFAVLVSKRPVFTTAAAIASAVRGGTVSGTIAAQDAVSYSVTAGAVPTGATLGASGTLTGTYNAAGTFSFDVKAAGTSAAVTAKRTFTQTIVETPTWLTSQAISSLRYDAVSLQLDASYAVQYTAQTALPAGLTLSSSGLLEGAATAVGAFPFTVRASSSVPAVFSDRVFTITVASVPTWVTPAGALDSYGVGLAVSFALEATTAGSYVLKSGVVPQGLSLASTGLLTGTPTTAETQTFTVRASSGGSVYADRTFVATVSSLPAWTTSSPLADIAKDAAYSFTLVASNTGSYTLQSGSLPAGVTLASATGVLSGTPTVAGSYSFTIRATRTGAASVFVDRAFTLLIATMPTWTTAAGLANTAQSVAYSFSLLASNASATGFAVTAGALPPGVSLGTDGTLSGTPSAVGAYSFTVKATSTTSSTVFATRAFTLTTVPMPVWTTTSLVDVAAGSVYSLQLTATNAVSFALKTGTLPTGLTLSSGGLLSGTPSAAGSFSFTITATGDAANALTDQALTQLVATTPTWVTSGTLSNTAQSVAYSFALVATNANATGFSVTSGALPPGVTLGANGTLAGTPTALSTYNFTVRALSTTSSTIFATRAFTLTTVPLPVWTTTSLVDVASGVVYSMQLAATNAVSYALKTGTLPTGLSLSSGGLLTGTPSAAGSFSFTITATGNATNALTDQALTQLVATTPTWTTAPSLANTAQNVAYSFALLASNANATGFSVTSGTLPAGVALSTAGVLSGTPTALATYSFTVRTSSTTSATIFADRAFTLTTVPLPVWTTTSLTDVASGSAYSVQLVATNAVSFAVKTGTLPTGLSLSSGGLLSGTPSASGTFSFTITATGNATNALTDQALTQIVATTPTWTTGAALLSTAQSVAYSFALVATDALVTGYSLLSGTLPAGVTLGTDGTLSGTPTAASTYNFTVRVRSVLSASIFADRAFSLTTVPLPVWSSPAAGALTDLPTGAAIATVNFVATDGLMYAVQTGTLPTGLALSSGGALTGTPTAAGSFSFTVRATGNAANATADRAFSQIVAAVPVWTTGAGLADIPDSTAVSFQFVATSAVSYALTSGSLPPGLSLSSGGLLTGTAGTTLATYSFTIRATGSSAVAFADQAFTQNVVSNIPLNYLRYHGVAVNSYTHSMVLGADGRAYGCGNDTEGYVTGTAGGLVLMTQVPVVTNIVEFGKQSPFNHTYAKDSSGQWWTWGTYAANALGTGSTTGGITTPVTWNGLANVVRMVHDGHTTGTSTFAQTGDGSWYRWGANLNGCLGTGNTTAMPTPTLFTALTNIKQVEGGHSAGFLFLLENGDVYALGLQRNATANVNLTTPTLVISNVKYIYGGHAARAHFVLKNDGTIWCWGRNPFGQLGLGDLSIVSYTAPVRNTAIEALGTIKDISTSGDHTLVLLSTGVVKAAGSSNFYKNATGNVTSFETLAGLPAIKHIIAQRTHCIYISESLQMYVSGQNANIECGIENVPALDPTLLTTSFALSPFAQTPKWNTPAAITMTSGTPKRLDASAAGTYYVQSGSLTGGMSLSMDGLISGNAAAGSYSFTVRAYGASASGFADRAFTLTVSDSGIKEVVCCSSAWTMMLMTDGTVYSQGYSPEGYMGNGSGITSYATPTKIASLSNIVDIAVAGNQLTFAALDASGVVWCWGVNNASNRTGTNTASGTNIYIPIANTFLPTITKLFSGGPNIGNVWAITTTGAVWTWGRTDFNAGTITGTATPITISGLTDIVKVSQGSTVVALSSTGVSYSFSHITSTTSGSTDQAMMGTGAINGTNVPRQLSTEVADVVAYNSGIVQLMKNGDVLFNGYQNVGNTVTTRWYFPTKNDAASGRNVVALYGGYGSAYYMRTGAGSMYYFDLAPDNDWLPGGGSSHATGYFMPVTVPTPMVKSLNEGYIFRTLWTQGQDGRVYALGSQTWTTTDTTATRYNDPVSVPVMTTFAQQNTLNSFGKYRGMAMPGNNAMGFYIRDNGLVYGYGDNSDSKVLGSGTGNLTLTQVSTLANIVQVACCESHSYAMDNSGAWYVWGKYPAGSRGDGSTTLGTTTPVAFTTPYSIAKIVCSARSSIAWTTNGDLVMWGANDNGELANGTTTMVSSPVPFTALTNVKTVYPRTLGFGLLLNNGDLYITGRRSGAAATTAILVSSNVSDLWGDYASQFLRKTDGSIWVWGENGRLTLGTGFASAVSHTSLTRHTALEALGTVKHIVSNNQATVVLLTSGAVYACGDTPYYKGTNAGFNATFELLSMPAMTYVHHNGYVGTYVTSDLKVYVSGNTYTGYETAGAFYNAGIRTPGFQIAPLGDKPYWSSPADLSGPALNVAYSKQLLAVDAYSFAVLSGTLPAGLALSSTGVLSGTPTAAGSYNWTVRALGGSTTTYADKAFSMDLAATQSPDAEFEALKAASRLVVTGGTFSMAAFSMLPKTNVYDFVAVDVTTGTTAVTTFNFSLWTGTAYNTFSATPAALSGYTAATSTGSTAVSSNTTYYTRFLVSMNLLTVQVYTGFTSATWTLTGQTMSKTYVIPADMGDASMENASFSSTGLSNVFSINVPFLTARVYQRGIAKSNTTSFVLASNGDVYGAGYNTDGRLTGVVGTASNTFTKVPSLGGITHFNEGSEYGAQLMYARDASGTWFQWGTGVAYERGDGTITTGVLPPRAFPYLPGMSRVVKGANGNTFGLAGGKWYMWGPNAQGQIGNGTTAAIALPTEFTALTGIKDVGSATRGFVFLLNNGNLYGTGNFDDTSADKLTPTLLTTGVHKVIGTDQGYIALKTTGWVYSSYIGNNTNTLATAPASLAILNSAPIRAFSASNAAVILYTTGASSGIGWSDNFSSTNAVSIPGGQAISGLPSNVAYAHIENHTTWVTYDLKFYTAGNNAGFQTGFNTGARNNTQQLTLGFQMAPLSRVPTWNTTASITRTAVGSAIAMQFDATDARAYRVVAGSLPAGLVMSQDGSLTGTVTASAGAFAFTVRAYGMTNNSISDRSFSWTITSQSQDTEFEAFKTAGRIAKVSNKYDLGSYSFLPTDGSYDFVVADRVTTTTPGAAFAFSLFTGGTGTGSFNTYGAKSASVASADTLLLLQGEGGSIVDTSTFARSVTNGGGVTQSSGQSRFGSKSLLFDGTANGYLTVPANASFAFGTGDYTIEAWILLTLGNAARSIVCSEAVNSAGSFGLLLSGSDLIARIDGAANDITAPSAISVGQWLHVAAVRASGVLTLYVNGTAAASGTRTQNVTQNNPRIGNANGFTIPFQGYMDELRIAPSAAYTSNFAVASSPFVLSNPASVTANTDYYARLRIDAAQMTYSLYSSFTPATWTFGAPIMTQTMPINATDVSMESLTVLTSSAGTLQNLWSANTPVLTAGTKVRTVSGTDNGTYILTSDGSVYAAGYNQDGRLSGTAGTANNTFFKIAGLSNIVRLTTYGASSMCMAQDTSGIWYMFGNTSQRGDGLTTSVLMPPTVWTYLKDVVDIVSCGSGRFAKTKAGLWYCWGSNGTGVIGQGNTSAYNTIYQTAPVQNLKDVQCCNNAALFLTNDGVLYGTGNFQDGVGNRTTPVQFLTSVNRVFAGNDSYIALKNDGTWWGGGRNVFGDLFLGNTTVVPAQTPVTIPYLNGIKVRALEMCSPGCALVTTSDGNVFAVGDGNVFRSTAGVVTTPVQLANVSGDVAYSRSGMNSHSATCTVKFDGKLWTSGATSTDYYQTGFAGGNPRNPTYLSGFTIAPLSRTPTWNTPSNLAPIVLNVVTYYRLEASDARLFKIVSGSLPTGITMGTDGLLTGTATVAAPFSVTVRAYGWTSGAFVDRTFTGAAILVLAGGPIGVPAGATVTNTAALLGPDRLPVYLFNNSIYDGTFSYHSAGNTTSDTITITFPSAVTVREVRVWRRSSGDSGYDSIVIRGGSTVIVPNTTVTPPPTGTPDVQIGGAFISSPYASYVVASPAAYTSYSFVVSRVSPGHIVFGEIVLIG
jgi:alpha-tubulin suppressor-like RCC1 family protein